MIASIKTTARLEMDEDELDILARLLDKIKNYPQRIGFRMDSFDEEETAMINGLCEWCGVTDSQSGETVMAGNTVID